MAGHADHCAAHRVLADPVGHLASLGVFLGLDRLAVEHRAGIASQVGAARNEPGHVREDGVEAGLEGGPGGEVLPGLPGRQLLLETGQRLAAPLGVPACPGSAAGGQAGLELLGPRVPVGAPAGAGGAVHGEHLVGYPEALFGGQTEDFLGGFDFLRLERVAVRLGAVGQMRRRPTDVGAQLEETRAVLDGHGTAHRVLERLGVVGYLAEVLGVPAVSVEALYRRRR